MSWKTETDQPDDEHKREGRPSSTEEDREDTDGDEDRRGNRDYGGGTASRGEYWTLIHAATPRIADRASLVSDATLAKLRSGTGQERRHGPLVADKIEGGGPLVVCSGVRESRRRHHEHSDGVAART